MPRTLPRLLLIVLLTALIAPAASAQPDARARIDPALLRLVEPAAQKSSGAAAGIAGDFAKDERHMLRRDGLVAIHAVPSGSPRALLSDLSRLGLEQGAVAERLVSGWLPERQIPALDELTTLRSVRPVYAKTRVGAVTSQGTTVMNTDDVLALTGFDGSGLRIGVLSDSYDALGGAATDVSTGDLPADVIVLEDLAGASDEGRAMMQLIHDVAPGAVGAFHTAFVGGEPGFAQGILDLRDAGSDIIVDDVFYFSEPMFTDGVINQAIEEVVADGVVYVTAAGNSGRNAYDAAYRPAGITLEPFALPSLTPFAPLFFGGEPHDFDPGPGVDIVQTLDIAPGAQIDIVFQWVDNYVTVFGEFPDHEFDIYLVAFNPDGSIAGVVDGSALLSVVADPIEIISGLTYTGAVPTQLGLMILRDAGFSTPGAPLPDLIKYINLGGGVEPGEYDTNSGSLWGHANADGAFATGASFYFNAPPFDEPAIINSYSSAGPTPIYFDTDGDRIGPVIRMKPDVVGPDATNTTFFIDGLDIEGDGFPNFPGTSAAAPHVAGLAALLLQADPSLTPAEMYDLIERTARDMDDPFTPGFDDGFDFGTGYGFVDALAAMNEIETCDPDFRITDFDADGLPTNEFIVFTNVGAETASLGGCTILAFDPFTEDVTFSVSPAPFPVAPGESVTFDLPPGGDALPDGPGALGLFDYLSVAVGTDVTAVLGEQVAAVVYFDEDNIFGTFPAAPSKSGDFLTTLRELAGAIAQADVPEAFALEGNYPNPFNPSTTIRYALPEAADVRLTVVDMLGREVRTLVAAQQAAGRYEAEWDGRDASGQPAASGLYLYTLRAGGLTASRPMMLAK